MKCDILYCRVHMVEFLGQFCPYFPFLTIHNYWDGSQDNPNKLLCVLCDWVRSPGHRDHSNCKSGIFD